MVEMTTIFTDESVLSEQNVIMSDLVDIGSQSASRNYRNQEGKEMAADTLHDFEQELVQSHTE
jgi:hypothetical protein